MFNSVRVTQIHKCISCLHTPLHFTFNIKLEKDLHTQKDKRMPPERIELPTPGLQDQCSTTELKRQMLYMEQQKKLYFKVGISLGTSFTLPNEKMIIYLICKKLYDHM